MVKSRKSDRSVKTGSKSSAATQRTKLAAARAHQVHEPEVSYTSRIRAIGNSRGVILSSQMIEMARLDSDTEILIRASDGIIIIEQVKEKTINTDLSAWDRQFKSAIKKGAQPEENLFGGLKNDFDSKEW